MPFLRFLSCLLLNWQPEKYCADYADLPDVFIRAHPSHPWSIWMRSGIADRRRQFGDFSRRSFETMRITSPNKPDRANRRQPLDFREPVGEADARSLTAVAHPGRSAEYDPLLQAS